MWMLVNLTTPQRRWLKAWYKVLVEWEKKGRTNWYVSHISPKLHREAFDEQRDQAKGWKKHTINRTPRPFLLTPQYIHTYFVVYLRHSHTQPLVVTTPSRTKHLLRTYGRIKSDKDARNGVWSEAKKKGLVFPHRHYANQSYMVWCIVSIYEARFSNGSDPSSARGSHEEREKERKKKEKKGKMSCRPSFSPCRYRNYY